MCARFLEGEEADIQVLPTPFGDTMRHKMCRRLRSDAVVSNPEARHATWETESGERNGSVGKVLLNT